MGDAPDSADYLVVGGGSAGCVVAARLSEDPSARVTLLEAGPEDRDVWIHVPAGYARLFASGRSGPAVVGRCRNEARGRRFLDAPGRGAHLRFALR